MSRIQSNRFFLRRKLRRARRGERRGVLLLVVLSILVLFAVVGVTFALVAGQFRRTSWAMPHIDQYAVNPRDQLDDAFKQVIRGTNNPVSSIGPHSLLEDMYGYDGIVSTSVGVHITGTNTALGSATLATDYQLLDLQLSGALPLPGTMYSASGSQMPGYFNGRVLTMTSGPLAGRSTRIVGYDPGFAGVPTLRVMAFEGSNIIPSLGQNFLINGGVFNGVGFGYNAASGLVNGTWTDGLGTPHQVALLPNARYASVTGLSGIPGADEDYDAPDGNNMALGLPVPLPLGSGGYPYPSFHRPELINYLATNGGVAWNQLAPDLLRSIMLRPSPVDHPSFTGSNPAFNPITGPWDVDTDGDGITDSVWVDLGLPPQTAPDGTLYKPLFAIHCLDLDGRLNVNAHGSSSHVEAARYQTVSGAFAGSGGGATTNSITPASLGNPNPLSASITLGSGYGPAEINLQGLWYQNPNGIISGNSALYYAALLAGAPPGSALFQYPPHSLGVEGRYGESNYLTTLTGGVTSTNYVNRLPYPGSSMLSSTPFMTSVPPMPGITPSGGVFPLNALAVIKHFELPIPGNPGIPTAYGSAPDLFGRGFVALGANGAPLMPNMSFTPPAGVGGAQTGQYDTQNNPYVLNLSRKAIQGALAEGSIDNPFTVVELERLLRTYDGDVFSLPSRLVGLLDYTTVGTVGPSGAPLGQGAPLATLRNQVTTISADPPAPNVIATQDMRNGVTNASGAVSGTPGPQPLAFHVADLLAARLMANGVTGTQLAAQMALMLPPDLMNGVRFDINRPFGNGIDDNMDGVVDDCNEYASNLEPAWVFPTNLPSLMPTTSAFPGYGNTPVNLAIDYNGDGINQFDSQLARFAMARYLYVLAMTLIDQNLVAQNLNLVSSTTGGGILYDNDVVGSGNIPNPLSTNNQFQLQYAIAQWAINAVDFRDRDSAMTPFEFDVNPFNGWATDGLLTTTTDFDNTAGMQTVVWGCERPEILLSETHAWHDRRTQDLSSTSTPVGPTTTPGNQTVITGINPGMSPDPDFDQHLVPLPAAFIELYNPWITQYSMLNTSSASPYMYAPTSEEVPGDLYYDPNNANTALQPYSGTTPNPPIGVVLNKLDPSMNSPVWRLAFMPLAATTAPNAPQIIDPDDPMLYPLGTQVPYDRVVYFVKPPATYDETVSTLRYYPSQPVSPLKPGRYAVVGSSNQSMTSGLAGVTPVSPSAIYVSKVGRTSNPVASDSNTYTLQTRRVVLAPDSNGNPDNNQFWVINSGEQSVGVSIPGQGEPTVITTSGGSGDAQPVIAVPIDQMVGATTARSFAISDPLTVLGYAANGAPTALPGGENELAYLTPFDRPQDGIGGAPGADPRMMINTTYQNHHVVYLQRLANPQLPWNATTNPYRTIDQMTMDVTAFNGAWVPNPTAANVDPGSSPPGTNTYKFVTTQRGDQYISNNFVSPPSTQLPSIYNQNNLLWAQEPPHPAAGANNGVVMQSGPDPNATAPIQIFNYSLWHTLGFLNQHFSANWNWLTPGLPTPYGQYYTSSTGPPLPSMVGGLIPTVNNPGVAGNQPVFPWLTWNNRPYVSPLELAMVPKSRSSRLLADYSTSTQTITPAAAIYQTQSATAMASNSYTGSPYFGHLLNFFDANSQPLGTNLNLYRLFEYVQVPSKFVGTETVLSPNYFTTPMPNESSFWSYLRPPFNKVSDFRDPGRLNINTVTDLVVWQGFLDNNPSGTPPLTTVNATGAPDVNSSRQGYPFGGGPYPSYFANPFRSFAGAMLTNSIYTNYGLPARRDIDVTLLRPGLTTGAPSVALFDYQPYAANTGTTNDLNDPTRSPYFRIQNASRAMNLLTTRSNVYATWITVGYFQVTPYVGVPAPSAHDSMSAAQIYPDGYQLGEELGSDTGEIKRHRAFYIFDRTIPVGFQRGEDLNVENGILLRRFIE